MTTDERRGLPRDGAIDDAHDRARGDFVEPRALAPARARSAAELAWLIIQHLDTGALLCSKRPLRCLFANPPIETALAQLPDNAMPESLRRIIASCGASFAMAQPIVWPGTGITYYVRAREVAGEPNLAIVTVAPARERAASRARLLREQYRLTHRQCLFVDLVCDGLTNLEISDRLCLTVGTVKQYLHVIFTTVGVRSRSALIRLVAEAD